MAITPSWSFNNGVISDAGTGWNYDLKKQGTGAQNTDQAMQMAMKDWQTKNVPGGWDNGVANIAALNPSSAGLTAARNSINDVATTWGGGQTWGTGNPMETRPDVAPSTAANQTGIANTAPLNQWGQAQGTPHNALTGGAPKPTVQQAQAADWGNSSGTQAGVKVTPGTGQTFKPSTSNALSGAINPATGKPSPQGSSAQAGQGGTAPPGSNPTLTPDEQSQGVIPPRTGPGAGRGYPSNWNSNNNPNLGGDTTFANNPQTGASYEVSPMYQFQKEAGEKAINRQLRARGRYNSSVGVNALANFNNQLGAMEADKQYSRVFQQQQLGLQAALEQARSAGASSGQLAEIYARLGGQMGQGSQQNGMNIADLIRIYGQAQTENMLKTGQLKGDASGRFFGPAADNINQQGSNQSDLATFLASLGVKGYTQYANRNTGGSSASEGTGF